MYLRYHDGIFFQPQSPTCLVEDITEIIRKEQDLSDSQYETDNSLLYSNQQVCIDLICVNPLLPLFKALLHGQKD
jgi:hypothetical protein